ncbi:hypothetical protein GCM10023184_14310 [Flaviaesturariibacter amylovorans]|uniref:DUF4412 domain-containing protein n=1 Tax=Flaviaesturariibacter amylovorans TaxID=1084520 RepID=A0ABP8GKB2_9BACT
MAGAGLCLTLAHCSDSSKNNASDNFAFNLPKGKTFLYSVDYTIGQEVQGQTINSRIQGDYSMEVTDETDSLKTLRMTYDRIAMNMVTPDQTITVDSDKGDTATGTAEAANMQGMMNKMFRSMKGKAFTMKVNREGKVVSIEGMQQMADAVVNSMGLPEEARAGVLQGFSQQFNDESLKETFSQSFNIFPNKPVKVGDTWTRTFAGERTPLNTKTTYTVKAIEGGNVVLDAKSDVSMTGQQSMKGVQTGTMRVDGKTGLVLNGEVNLALEGPMKMTSKGTFTGKPKS